MELIADLHLHSKYSRAVSPQMVISEIADWADIKGIKLVGIPDWTHPLWIRELKADLVEVGEGIFAYKERRDGPKFILVTEISSIYSQAGKTRRIHNLVFAPDFEIVGKINEALRNRGANLLSDGRPIIGLSAKELAETVLSIDADCLIIPAHAWTPWFSLYGSNSGFDSIKECFGEFSSQISAIETGLSSDPAMNWRIEELDDRAIVSFSDAHSLAKLGREVTVFKLKSQNSKVKTLSRELKINYQDIIGAIKKDSASDWEIGYTIEFYPEEGKYHWTGHRQCGVRQSPEETRRLGATCPVCGRRLTIGVMHRVEQLAKREQRSEAKEGKTGIKWLCCDNRPPYVMLVPLLEVLSEALETGISSQKNINEYNRLTSLFGGEFSVLLKTPIAEITKSSGERIGEAVRRVRSGEIVVDPGYDGVFGKVAVWQEQEGKGEEKKQMSLF
ncbi:MAG TPA: endonuclease Q family protein [Candidatus Bathyarchaeia archaeon]|nr:endonuclease Q family protein [Candidatus Bathyarchaeia archaeon]